MPIAVPLRPSRRLELAAEGYECAESLEAARDAGATAAVIATSTGRHVADIEKGLSLGLWILSEKPLSTTFSAAAHLPALAARKGVGLFVAYCLRFDEGLQVFRDLLPTIGQVHSARIECRSFLPDWRPGRDYRSNYSARADEGGVILDLSHEIDYGTWLLGQAELLTGETGSTGRLDIEAEEIAEAAWVTVSGVRVSMALDYVSRCPVRFVRASGSEGELTYDFISGGLTLQCPGLEKVNQWFERRPTGIYEAQERSFLRALEGHSPGVLASGDEALAVLRVCDAWRASGLSWRREMVQ